MDDNRQWQDRQLGTVYVSSRAKKYQENAVLGYIVSWKICKIM